MKGRVILALATLLLEPARAVPAERQPGGRLGMGIWTRNLSRAERAALPAGEPDGAIVYAVVAGSPADAAGVRPGVRVVRVDGRAVASEEALGRLFASGSEAREIRLELRDGGLERIVSIRRVEQQSYLDPACQAGDGDACWDIVLLYGWQATPPPGATGRAPSEEYACALGSQRACKQEGFRLASSAGGRARGLQLLEQSCESGEGDACRILGQAYARGSWKLGADRKRAVAFLYQACDSGIEPSGAGACLSGAELLAVEGAPERDLALARSGYEEACLRGIAEACHQLGRMCRDGRGGPRDVGKALSLLQRACEGDVPDACLYLGGLGSGVAAQDAQRGLRLLNAECVRSPSTACPYDGYSVGGSSLVIDLARNRRMCDAKHHPRISRHPRLCLNTAFLYELGGDERFGEDSLAAAVEACDRGNAMGCWRAGELLANGQEVEADVARALSLLQRACDSQLSLACNRLDRV